MRVTDLAKELQKPPISARKACALEHRGNVRKDNQGNALKTALNGRDALKAVKVA